MKKNFYPRKITALALLAFIGLNASAQISGTVFRDVNSNGVRESANPTEPGEFGITVKAYNAVNALIATDVTDANGDYQFTAGQIPAGTAVRLEFILPGGNFSSKRAGADRSNVQFVSAGASAINIDFAIAAKKFLSSNSNPYLATTAYTNGEASATGAGNAGDNEALYVFPYDLSSDGGPTRRAKNEYIGAVYGLAWQRESRTLFMAAYLKRHVSFGPKGIGAIYQSQIATDGVPATPSLLLDVTSLGIDVGSDPRTVALPGASNGPSTDPGVFAEVGKRGIGGMAISDDGRDLYLVNLYEKKLHRINIGNPLKSSFSSSDVTGSWVIPDPKVGSTEWHPMAVSVHEGKIYVGGVTSIETIKPHDIADTADMKGIVYEFDLSTNTFTEVLNFPLSYRRGYTNADYRYEYRDNFWCAWQNNGDVSIGGPLRSGLIGSTTGGNATGIYYPQPMMSKIIFDVDGSMIVGLRDRFGDQGGYANYFETGNVPGELYRALSSGEILRAGKAGSNWVIEDDGKVCSGGVTTTTPGLTSNNPAQLGSFPLQLLTPWGGSYGPGGGYYYYNQNFSLVGVPAPFNSVGTVTGHYVKSNGGLALIPGYNEVVMTAIDPLNTSFSNGILKNYNLGANAGNMCGRLALIASASGDPTNMGKACALGDVEVLYDAMAVEIGNRVWNDLNANGRQDANEPGIAGVTVVLRSPGTDGNYNTGDDETWTTTTDPNGNYYFDETFVNDTRRPASWIGVSATNSGILPGFEYKVEIDGSQAPVSSLVLTYGGVGSNETDNDGTYNALNVEYVLNSGGSGAPGSSFENNYNLDFGFTNNFALALKQIELSAILIGEKTKVKWQTTQELHISRYMVEKSTDGRAFTAIGTVQSQGDGSFAYEFIDDAPGIKSGKLFYRLRVEDIKGKSTFTKIVFVSLASTEGLIITPNPFHDVLNVQVSATQPQSASITLTNAAGQTVARKSVSLSAGTNSFSMEALASLPAGMYVVSVDGSTVTQKQKIVKQ